MTLSSRQARAVHEEVVEIKAAAIVASVVTLEFKKGLHSGKVLAVLSLCTIYRFMVKFA